MHQGAPIPDNEQDRISAVRQLCVLDTEPEPVFDHLTSMACTLFQVPMALVSIVDGQRQFFKSATGLAVTETPRSQSFCAYTILSQELLIIPDTRADARFENNPLVTGSPHLRFYAGAPLRNKHGLTLGSFCVLSNEPRSGLSPTEQDLLIRFAALASDALEQRLYPARLAEAEKALQETNERYRLAARATQDGLWDWDLTSGQIYYSPRLRKMMGYEEEEHWATIQTWIERLHPEDASAAKENVQRLLQTTVPSFENEYRMRHEDGTWRWVHNRGVAVRNEAGKLLRLTGAMRDMTRERTRDSLTGLETRVALINAIDQRIGRTPISKPFALLCLDLDNFKRVNDSFGADCGDDLLLEVAHRLKDAATEHRQALVARILGDEFAVLADGLSSLEESTLYADQILAALQEPFSCHGQDVKLDASVGVAYCNEICSSTTQTLEDAQFAMHQAKARGGRQSAGFVASLRDKARYRLGLEADLRLALANDQVCLFYQPKIDMLSGAIVGFEALMRWKHAEHGMISPAEFIPLAEESDLIVEVGDWTLREAVRQLSLWRKAGLVDGNTTMAVNLSAKQFCDTGLCAKVQSTVDLHTVPPACLDLEVTEGVLVEDAQKALQILRELKAIGIGLDLDDFGTGYSSLGYLKRFPFDTLKIDRSFVHDLVGDPDSPAIVRSILALANALRLRVVAEGVETQAQADLLVKMGCRYAQGFLFHKPRSADEITGLLQERPRFSTLELPAISAMESGSRSVEVPPASA